MLNNRMGKVLAERGAVGYKYCRRTAATRMDRMHTPLGTHIGKYCTGTRRSADIVSRQQVACYPAACAS